ncbi:uromodulin-like [Chiloscyllium plagiosum]|uniref:uromodulin-like n=1 Tax=Chiloscyllium plagiosum TaxID=36176 RepID=UPI001CB84C24|nr:uromodulin-like [Chiloscyllium plagiosum]
MVLSNQLPDEGSKRFAVAQDTQATILPTSSVGGSFPDPCADQGCTEWERCGQRHGNIGCVCTNQTRSRIDNTFDYSLSCNGTGSAVSLSRCMLFDVGLSTDSLHLNDPSCVGSTSRGRVIFPFVSNRITCGNKLQVNSTHFIYSNAIRGLTEADSGAIITRQRNVTIEFSCAYPLTMNISSSVVISTMQSVINITLPGGQKLFESKMVVYRDSGYSQPFNQTPVVLDINSKIYVGTIVSGVDASRFVLTLKNCWATPGSDPKQATHWVFITEQCPTVHDSSVNVEESGHSTVARFSLSLFQFVGDSSGIYIHCQIQLCDVQSSRCLMECLQRRASGSHNNGSIHTIGPFQLKSHDKGEFNGATSWQSTAWVTMAMLWFPVILGCCHDWAWCFLGDDQQ